MIKVRRPARTLLQLLNAREKVFRPQGIFPFRKRSRRQPVAFVWQERWRDFVFSDSWRLVASAVFSAQPRRSLRLCRELSFEKTHRRDAENTEIAQRDFPLEHDSVLCNRVRNGVVCQP